MAAWAKRVDEGGACALLDTHEPVNRLPDYGTSSSGSRSSARPHQGLGGRTPTEIIEGDAKERAPLSLDHPIELIVRYHEKRKKLPIVELKQEA